MYLFGSSQMRRQQQQQYAGSVTCSDLDVNTPPAGTQMYKHTITQIETNIDHTCVAKILMEIQQPDSQPLPQQHFSAFVCKDTPELIGSWRNTLCSTCTGRSCKLSLEVYNNFFLQCSQIDLVRPG